MDKVRADYLKASLNAAVVENPHELLKAFNSVNGCEQSKEYDEKLSTYVNSRMEC